MQIKYSRKEEIPEKDKSPKQINYLNFRENILPNDDEHNKSFIHPESNQIIKKLENFTVPLKFEKINSNENHIEKNTTNFPNLIKNKSSENLKKVTKSIIPHIELFQSHFNGIPYEEYIFKFSKNKEMKLKFSLGINDLPLKIQFTDDEIEYEDASMDKIYVYLRNIEKIVKLKNCGLNCAVQTTRVKLINNYSQTKLTNSNNSFSRLNVGVTVKNIKKTFFNNK